MHAADLPNQTAVTSEPALTQTTEAMGGSVEGLCYAFGNTDLYIICDHTDDATATAVSLNLATLAPSTSTPPC